MRGYIKLYRQIAENAIWLIKPFSEGQAWVDLLCISTFDKGFIKTKNGQIIELTAGDCGYSQLSLSERWGWSRGKVKRFILLLEKQKMIQQKMYGKYSVINILNYEKYQNRTTNDTTNNTINDTTTEQQMIQQTNTINNDKNDNNEKNDKNDNTHINACVCELTESDKKVLRKYAKKSNAYNIDAYIYSLIKSGSYKEIINEHNQKEKLKKNNIIKMPELKEPPEVTEQAYLKFKQQFTNRRSK